MENIWNYVDEIQWTRPGCKIETLNKLIGRDEQGECKLDYVYLMVYLMELYPSDGDGLCDVTICMPDVHYTFSKVHWDFNRIEMRVSNIFGGINRVKLFNVPDMNEVSFTEMLIDMRKKVLG